MVREDRVAPKATISAQLSRSNEGERAVSLTIEVALDTGDFGDYTADFWLYAKTPFGFFWFDPAQFNWVPGFDLAYQGRLFSVGTTEVLNVDGVPAGSYAFVFGVDLNPRGGLDFDQFHEDRVVVQVN